METIIDTYGGKKPMRHHATVSKHDGVAWTNCNRRIVRFWDAIHTSWFYADGRRYAWPCAHCFPTEYRQLKNEEQPKGEQEQC